LIVLARELRLSAEAGRAGGHDRDALLGVRRRIVIVLAAQLVLGILAAVWVYVVTGPHKPVSIGEAIFATLHVVVGALLLWATVAAAMYSRRLVSAPRGATVAGGRLEGAR
jgi:cation transporter-like permease